LNDQVRFIQVFTNLLNNALKFTEIGKVTFGYEVLENMIRFFVADTGIGIDSAQIGKVFNRFFKAENNTQKQYGGTGIGLTISKKLVNLMGGSISVESVVNSGSVFYFSLPYLKDDTPRVKQQKSDTLKINLPAGVTILVAEDDPTNYSLLAAILKPSGLKVFWAHNGQEAINFIKNKPVDEKCIVLMDIKMPVMDGYEAKRQIKLIDESIPVIAVTAYAQKEDREKIILNKFDGYIAKPFSNATLFSVLSNYGLPDKH
jgi:two-component system CheB/CheR fusion protein